MFAGTVLAQQVSQPGSFWIGASGAVTYPMGRFAEKDVRATPPKIGHNPGFGGGFEIGYFFSEMVAVGVAGNMAQFELDPGIPGIEGHTRIVCGQAWGRFFLAGGYQYWRPYLYLGAGIGRPKGEVEYSPPAYFDTLEVQRLESTVKVSGSVSGGIGVLIPVSGAIGINLEPRIVSVFSKGATRTDLAFLTNGTALDLKDENEGDLKARYNPTWWEVRLGLFIIVH